MKNLVDQYYGYNDTISGMISKMCLEAYAKYDKERLNVDDRTAMSRAIGDTFKKNIEIFTQEYSMNPELIEMHLNNDSGYVSHIEKATFMKFAESTYESNNYRVEKFNNLYEYRFKYQLALFKIGELK